MNPSLILAEAVTWPEAFLGAVGAVCMCVFWCCMITERWPWDRR